MTPEKTELTIFTAKEQLAALEEEVIEQAIQKLSSMVKRYCDKEFITRGKTKCDLHHLQESVKLAHQIRSLIK